MSCAIQFPCKICKYKVTNSDQAISCDLCASWVDIKCNELNQIDYKFLHNPNDPWFCISCCSDIFPFDTVKNRNFISNFYDSNNKSKNTDEKHSSLLLKLLESLKHLINQFHNISSPPSDINSDYPENTVSSKYYHMEELRNLKFKRSHFSLFDINECSIYKNFDDLQDLLSCTNKKFDITAITETRITKKNSILNSLNIENYSIEFTPTESSAGGTLLYIANHLSYKPCQDLTIYKKNELESTFIEIVYPQNSNIIVATILILIVIT